MMWYTRREGGRGEGRKCGRFSKQSGYTVDTLQLLQLQYGPIWPLCCLLLFWHWKNPSCVHSPESVKKTKLLHFAESNYRIVIWIMCWYIGSGECFILETLKRAAAASYMLTNMEKSSHWIAEVGSPSLIGLKSCIKYPKFEEVWRENVWLEFWFSICLGSDESWASAQTPAEQTDSCPSQSLRLLQPEHEDAAIQPTLV